MAHLIERTDKQIVEATQAGLPLDARPYDVIAKQLGLSPQEVMERMERMLRDGVIRRIGVVPNHYALGYRANGMSVWNVADDEIARLGPLVGALEYVSHCYQRPRFIPDWPYNLFAMVHGHARDEVEAGIAGISDLLGDACMGHEILYSKQILKKTGLRLVA